MKSREKLVENLNAAELFLRNRANALPAPLNEYDVEALKDISQLICKAISVLERAIVPPCKVGEKCYMVLEKLTGGYEVVETKLTCFKQKDDLIIASCFINAPLINNSIEFYNDEIYTSIFITKEEAEKALAEKESD